VNIAGSRKEAVAKQLAKDENESGSDYEEVPVDQDTKSKAMTLPAKLQSSMNVLREIGTMLCKMVLNVLYYC